MLQEECCEAENKVDMDIVNNGAWHRQRRVCGKPLRNLQPSSRVESVFLHMQSTAMLAVFARLETWLLEKLADSDVLPGNFHCDAILNNQISPRPRG